MSDAPAGDVARVACVGCDAPTLALVREALAVGLPGTQVVERASAASVPDEACAVLQATPSLDGALRDLRARGYAGAVVVIVNDDGDAAAAAAAAAAGGAAMRLGVSAAMPRARVARELPAAVATARGTLDASGRPNPAWAALRRVEHLVAAGEVALGLRHALNNPLTGLLAEAQLLEMEPLPAEQLQAVRRIVELCRRTIAVTRQLDAIPPRPGAGGQQPDAGAA